VTIDKNFNMQSLQFKSLEQVFELVLNFEQQGNLDLTFRISELQDKIVSGQISKYRKEVLKINDDCNQNTYQSNTKDTIADETLQPMQQKKEKNKSWQKDLSRRISLKTHPDKLCNLKKEDLDHYVSLYRKSTKAYSEKDDALLLVCGHEVRIKPKSLSNMHVDIIKVANKSFNEKIKKKKESDGFVWYHMNEEDKTTFLINYIKQRGFIIKKEQVIEIIKRKKPKQRKQWERPLKSLNSQRRNKK